jgi:DNA/RNA endonuclease YhcR with UshA esterase domain
MRRARLALWVIFIVVSAAGLPASAHHSFNAVYFEDRTVSIEGDVLEFEYRNPHAWVHLTVKDERGEIQKFSAEWSNPARLKQQGLTAETIKPGDHVIITGNPGRNPAERRIHLRGIHRLDDGWRWPLPRTR